MRIISVVIFIVSSSVLLAQSKELDSLKKELVEVIQDTSRVEVLNELSYKLHRSNPEEGIHYARESIKLAKLLSFETGLARAYNSLGACFWNQSELDSALKYYGRSYKINEKLGIARGTTGALSNMAIIYNNRGDYVNAIDTYSLALEEMRKEGFDSYIAITLNNIGLVFEKIGNYPEALKYFKEAIKIGEPLNMTNLTGPAWINVGNVYNYTDEPQLELEAKKKALEIGTESNDKYIMSLAFNNLGNVYKRRAAYNLALAHFEQALAINEEVGRKTSIALNLSNIGSTYREMGKYEESLQQLKEALTIAHEIGHERRITRINYQLGLTTKELRGCNDAIPFFLNGYQVATSSKNLLNIRDISEKLYECYLSNGDYESAVVYHVAYMAAKDSILNEENIKELAKVEAQFKYENQLKEKNTEIALLESKEQLSNLRITLLIIVVVLVLIVAFFVSRMVILKKERKKRELESIAQFRESMTGMIAHDMKTPLSVIMNSNDELATKNMARQMLQLINNMLDVHRFETTEVRLKSHQESFTDLVDKAQQQVNYLLSEKDLKLIRDYEGDHIVLVDGSMMLRVLVNLLTNAIKFSPFNERITIKGEADGDLLKLSIHNKGKTISPESMGSIFESFGQVEARDSGGIGSTGLGLTFVQMAVEAHGSQIEVYSDESEGTTFSFQLPLIDTRLGVTESTEHFALNPLGSKVLKENVQSLRKLKIHQIGEIEKELQSLRGKNEEADAWLEELLNSAYSGNKEKFEALLKMIN